MAAFSSLSLKMFPEIRLGSWIYFSGGEKTPELSNLLIFLAIQTIQLQYDRNASWMKYCMENSVQGTIYRGDL